MARRTRKQWRVGKPLKSHMSDQLMYPIEGPGVISDYEDWGLSKKAAEIAVAALNEAEQKDA